MRSTVARRLSTLGSFYRYCHVEGILERNPAANVRRPKVDVESRTLGLDRNGLGGLLVQAGLGSARDHALISLLALNGLRISEALGADVESMDTSRRWDMDRGHRTLAIVRKCGKHVVIALAPRTARTLDLYLGERTTGPIFLGSNGKRMDRYAADRTVKRLAKFRVESHGERLGRAGAHDGAARPTTKRRDVQTGVGLMGHAFEHFLSQLDSSLGPPVGLLLSHRHHLSRRGTIRRCDAFASRASPSQCHQRSLPATECDDGLVAVKPGVFQQRPESTQPRTRVPAVRTNCAPVPSRLCTRVRRIWVHV